MPELKSLLMLLVITIVAAGATWYVKDQIQATYVTTDTAPLVVPDGTLATTTPVAEPEVVTTPPNQPAVTPKPTTPPQSSVSSIEGTLTEVNTGCFADGECYAMVDGKKVVLLIGWYQGKVGKIIGADSIGDLEAFIGTKATVSAGKDSDGNYTLLGNESFYLQVATTTKPITTNSCVVGGCSSQLCGEASEMNDMVTTCEYKPEYACYQKATCERQATGKCGWTESAGLTQCLKNPN